MTAEALLWMIGRATLFTSASALVAAMLLSVTKIRAPRIHRGTWLLVVVQVWLLVPIVWQLELPVVETTAVSVELVPTPQATLALPSPIVVSANNTQEPAHTNYARVLVVVWLVGGAMMALSRALRYLRFVRQLPTEAAEMDASWRMEWERQLRAARVRRKVELRVTRDLGPLVCFVPWQYLVLVPRALWVALDRRARSAILRHEIAHLVRGDLWWSLAIRVLALPQWFNPLVWLAVRRFDEAGEWACDDWVCHGNRGRELTFARSLVAAAEYATTGPTGTASVQGGKLARRVRRLVMRHQPAETTAKKLLFVLPLALIVIAQVFRIEYVQAKDPLALPEVATAGVETASYRATPPQYMIEPPDMLLINAVKLVPKPPHEIGPFDCLLVRVLGALPDQPIADVFAVDPDGKIDLGPSYGRVEVASLTVDEAKTAISRELAQVLESPLVSVSLASSAGAQQIAGKHLVGPDGRVNLGIYGTVYVSGMTIDEARTAIEKQLSEYLLDPQVVVDVANYNSKKYYVITRNARRGDNVAQAPITGNETVLDALATIDGLPRQSTDKIWISRPAPNGAGSNQILPVNWDDISQGKSTSTNYQLHPGDRLFVTTAESNIQVEDGGSRDKTYSEIPTGPTPAAKESRLVTFRISLIEDEAHNLDEFGAMQGELPFVALDSVTILPTLRILKRNNLIKEFSPPMMTCLVGQKAIFGTGHKDFRHSPNDRPTLHFLPKVHDGNLMLQFGVIRNDAGPLEFSSSIPLKIGQTILVRMDARTPEVANSKIEPPQYVALTPTMIGEAPNP